MSFRIHNKLTYDTNCIKGIDIIGKDLDKGELIQFTGKFWSYTDLPNLNTSTGPTGPKGEQGPFGKDGERGPKGIQGKRGAKGERGSKGLDGSTGPTGAQGERGIEGPIGVQGPRGLRGIQGVRGSTGPSGPGGDFLNNFRSKWEFNSGLIPITPEDGNIAFNNVTGSGVTQILVSSFTIEGSTTRPILELAQDGNKIFLCSFDNTNCKLWEINSVEEFGTYFIFNVTFDNETLSSNFSDGERIKIFFDIFSNQVMIQQNQTMSTENFSLISDNENDITNLQILIQQKDTEISSLEVRVSQLENLIRRNIVDNTIEVNGSIKITSF